MCNYEHSVRLTIRFGAEDPVFGTASDNYSDCWSYLLEISIIDVIELIELMVLSRLTCLVQVK